jgi:subtilisin family serine protease
VLQWNNPNEASADDFDLFLADGNSGVVVRASLNVQSGTQNAYETVTYTNLTGAAELLFIAIGEFHLVSVPSSLIFDYYVFPRCALSPLQYAVASDSVIGHGAVAEVLSVAALDALMPTVAESYSSQGPGSISFPAPETRSVPNISGIDCVSTEVGLLGFFTAPFCGTSAAAPHVAAIAALMIERNPALTSAQIRGILTGSAVDLGSGGFDFTFGFGRADALNAVAATPLPIALQSVTPDTASPQAVGTVVTWTAVATGGTAPLAYQFFARRVEDGGGFLVVQAWGASASVALRPTVAGTYQIAVWVRSAGGSAPEAGGISASFAITP